MALVYISLTLDGFSLHLTISLLHIKASSTTLPTNMDQYHPQLIYPYIQLPFHSHPQVHCATVVYTEVFVDVNKGELTSQNVRGQAVFLLKYLRTFILTGAMD